MVAESMVRQKAIARVELVPVSEEVLNGYQLAARRAIPGSLFLWVFEGELQGLCPIGFAAVFCLGSNRNQ